MFYKIYEEKLAVYDDNKERLLSTMSFMPQLENERLLETDIVTADELNEHPNKVLVDDIQIEIEVPEYETITEEYEEVVSETDIMGEPVINTEIKTREVTVQTGSHTEIITVKGLVLNPDFEAEQAQKEAERIGNLYLTGADVERGIYKAKGMDFDDILAFVMANPPVGLDVKALRIELKANNFYRGNPYVDAVGTLLGFTEEQLDKFFETNDYTVLLPPVEEPIEGIEDEN